MLTGFVFPALWNLGLDPATLYFQQDGATAHTAHQSMNLLMTVFQHWIISCFGDINWPETCSADLNSLKQRIMEEVNAISAKTLSRIMKSMVNWVHECINMNGWHLTEVIFKKWHFRGSLFTILVIPWFYNKWQTFLFHSWLFWCKFIDK
jgi:hypothetical protein